MLLGSPPDMVHRAPAHGAHIRMQNSAIYSPVRFKYYTIPFGKLQVAVGGWGRKFLLKRFEAIPHNSKCRYGERGAADAKPKAQIILCILSSILATQMQSRSRRSGACRQAGIVRCCLNKNPPKSFLFIVLGPCTSLFYTTNTESTFLLQNVAITKPADTSAAATADSWSDYEVGKA